MGRPIFTVYTLIDLSCTVSDEGAVVILTEGSAAETVTSTVPGRGGRAVNRLTLGALISGNIVPVSAIL